MKEVPILFSTAMVQALLAGRKTQTRRIAKPQGYVNTDGHPNWKQQFAHEFSRWRPGDLLWVRETWSPKYVKGCLDEYRLVYPETYPWTYLADDPTAKAYGYGNPWKPSIHMPKSACRIWLQVDRIRLERVQDIKLVDVLKEGAGMEVRQMWLLGQDQAARDSIYRQSYKKLWVSINGEESWQQNPWVWVIDFKVLSTTGKPNLKIWQTSGETQ